MRKLWWQIRVLLLPVLALLLGSVPSQGQHSVYAGKPVLSSTGQGIQAYVRVCTSTATSVPCTPLATIYTVPLPPSDPGSGTPISGSTVLTDSNGNYQFGCAPGLYQIQITSQGGAQATFADACPATSSGGTVITGVPIATVTGNTTVLPTWNGAATPARCVDTDGSGNLQVTALDCGGGSPSSPLVNRTLDVFNRSSLGANWTVYLNSFTVASGIVQGQGTGIKSLAAYTGTPSAPTQISSVVVTALNGTTDAMGAAVRISGTPTTSVNYYDCAENSTTLYLEKFTGGSNGSIGTYNLLASQSVTGAAGDILTLYANGNTLICTHNGDTPILQVNDSASPFTTGLPGMAIYGGVATVSSYTFTGVGAQPGAGKNIVVDGDSIVAPALTAAPSLVDSPASYLSLTSFPSAPAYVTNVAVGAKCLGVGCAAVNSGTIESMLSTGTSIVDTLYVPALGAKNILILEAGGNDMDNASRTPAQVYADLTTYITARHATGWKVIVVPLLSRKAVSKVSLDVSISIYNSLLRANTAGADGIVSLPLALTGMGNSRNTTFFNADQTHPTQAAQTTVVAPAYSAIVNTF